LINYFFWAYDKKIPIAKIVTNDELTITETFRSSLLNKTDSERRATIENQFSTYDIMLYTYTSSIPVGLKSETDPSGKTIYYEYDFAGRLKNIKDHNHHLLKSFEYHKANSAAY
jgi:YD repeat-containing protein